MGTKGDIKLSPKLPISPQLQRQMPSRIGDDSETASSLYLRQPQQSLSLGNYIFFRLNDHGEFLVRPTFVLSSKKLRIISQGFGILEGSQGGRGVRLFFQLI